MKSEDALAVQQQEIQPTNMEANVLEAIIQLSRDKDARIDVIERLVALQERQETRHAQTAFMNAMADCQKEIPQIQQDGRIMVKGQERSRFALHEDIDFAIRPIYTAHGFAVSYGTTSKDNKVEVSCTVSHRQGHSKTEAILLPIDASEFRSAIQSIGSTITYAKRQLLGMHFNIVTRGKDNDGQGGGAKITDDQAKDLQALMEEVKQDIPRFLNYFKIEKVSELPAKELAGAIQDLERKRK